MCLVCMAQAKPQMHLIEKWFQIIFMLLKLIEFIWETCIWHWKRNLRVKHEFIWETCISGTAVGKEYNVVLLGSFLAVDISHI
jgi:hypothetical protein